MELHPKIHKLIAKTGSNAQPMIVNIQTESYAEPLQCFNNVKTKVERDGGSILYGWTLWVGGFLCEAEFHAIWQDKNGNLFDVTPYDNYPFDNILFLPHPEIKYNGELIDNHRVNLTENLLVDDFIKISEFNTRIKSTGEKVGNDYLLIGKMAILANVINEWKINLETFILNDKKAHDNCFCGRTFSYKNCHGKEIDKNLNMIFQQAQH